MAVFTISDIYQVSFDDLQVYTNASMQFLQLISIQV